MFDVMSYCKKYTTAWISNFHWNRLVDLWATGGTKATTATERPALAAAPGLRVEAVLSRTGGPPYVHVSEVRAVPSMSDPAGPITVTAYDDAGAVAATLRAPNLTPEDAASVDVVLPVASASRIELTNAGSAPATIARSATAPAVTLSTLRGGGVVRARNAVRLAWTMTDADGDRLRADVQYSTNDGRTWQTIAALGADTSVRLAPGLLTTTARGRLRVVVSDGLRQSTAMSGRLRVTGAAPAVTLVTKGTLRTTRNAPVVLSAYAFDGAGASLRGARLRWMEGRKALGQGETITLRYAKKGTHLINFVATDRSGLKTTRTLRVVVR
jgi:hypothetical protein